MVWASCSLPMLCMIASPVLSDPVSTAWVPWTRTRVYAVHPTLSTQVDRDDQLVLLVHRRVTVVHVPQAELSGQHTQSVRVLVVVLAAVLVQRLADKVHGVDVVVTLELEAAHDGQPSP